MSDPTPAPAPATSPRVPIALVASGGERTIEGTYQFFAMLGYPQAPGEGALPVPVSMWAGIGVAVKLYRWEERGVRVHRDGGLPSAQEVLDELLRRRAGPPDDQLGRFVTPLLRRVVELMTQFASEGPAVLGADVVLGEPDDDALIEGLAHLCWACRKGAGVDQP